MKFATLIATAVLISVATLTGCSSQGDSVSAPTKPGIETEQPSSATEVASAWECETTEDGLGETFGCQSNAQDEDGNFWVFTLMCTSDKLTLHSVLGMHPDASFIDWDESNADVAKVSIDSGAIKEWKFQEKGDRAFAFTGLAGKGKDENASTWELLKTLASAKSLGFKTYDAQGTVRSARFEVQGTVPIAAKFAALGCGA